MDRILDSAEGRDARMRRFGRIAAIAYLISGVAAIPANILIEPGNEVIYWMPLLGIVPGLIFFFLPWERLPEWTLHVPLVAGTAMVAAAAAIASIAFSAYYVFIAVFLALAF